MTAGSSHNDGFGTKGPRRAPATERVVGDLEFDPTLPPLELFELEPTLPPPPPESATVDPPPTLAPETPLPRCLTDAVSASSRPGSGASQIPPAPKLPRFSLPAGRNSAAADDETVPNSETCLGLPTDRVLPGSPALVSTFRPKPQTRSCYSVTNSCQEERVYAPKRTRKAKPPAKHRR